VEAELATAEPAAAERADTEAELVAVEAGPTGEPETETAAGPETATPAEAIAHAEVTTDAEAATQGADAATQSVKAAARGADPATQEEGTTPTQTAANTAEGDSPEPGEIDLLIEPGLEAEPHPEAGPDAEAEPHPKAQPDPETQPHPKAEPDTETEPGLAAEPDTEAVPVQAVPGDAEAITQAIALQEARETAPDVRETGHEARETVLIAVPERTPAPELDERPFWMPVQEMPRGSRRPPVRGRPGRPPKPPRRPATGLIALLVLALTATFFAWVSAEPLWLAVGHGDKGTATVTECTGDGVSQRCLGEFTAASGMFTAERVRLLGVGDRDGVGTTVAAKMVGADSGRAYVDAANGLLHLRWGLGMGLVVLCGLGIVWATGALRLEDRRSRRRAALAGLAAPLLVAIAFLAATF
jgi:hypothetical protein